MHSSNGVINLYLQRERERERRERERGEREKERGRESTREYAPEDFFNVCIYLYYINYLPTHANKMNIMYYFFNVSNHSDWLHGIKKNLENPYDFNPVVNNYIRFTL